MKEKMLNNIGLKIVSVFVAIIFWGIIVNIYDPSVKVTISGVNVQLLNEKALSDMGYSYEVEDGSKIAVYVSGPRSLVSGISASDIIATVDLSTVNIYSDYVDIAVKLQKSGTAYAAVQVAPKTTAVKVSIENRATKTFEIAASVVNKPAAGFVVGDFQISPSTVTITGAQSLIDSIESVKTVVDVNGAKEDLTKTCELEVYDRNGKIISKDTLDMSRKSIDVKVTVFTTKEVELKVEHKGNPANGYILTGVEPEQDKLVIAGDIYELEGVDSITIPAEAVDITGIDKDTVIKVELNKYLPAGIITDGKEFIEVNVKVEAIESKRIIIDNEDIEIKNIAEDYTAEITGSAIGVSVSGREIYLNEVSASTLKPSINLEGMQEGVHEVTVELATPNGCNINGVYKVTVNISAKQSIAQAE